MKPVGTALAKVAIGCIFGRSDDIWYVRVGHGFMSLSIKWIRFTRFGSAMNDMFGGPNLYEGGTYERKNVEGCKEQRMSFRLTYARYS